MPSANLGGEVVISNTTTNGLFCVAKPVMDIEDTLQSVVDWANNSSLDSCRAVFSTTIWDLIRYYVAPSAGNCGLCQRYSVQFFG
ncbi:hypothetical protein GOP47_0017821 [Adiantum capillus-veneris]|uniref:Uncharacterized protein n=1 Tax=Adiantum capillus-veneris TaxID=13818 RepID=A0A9D4UGZ5_ADICA|nr:hypothetical protein GOP47_0017821 [Adiantum capillus-veneris]